MKIKWALLVVCIFLSAKAMEENKAKERPQYIIEREMCLYDSFWKAAEQQANQQKKELKTKRPKSVEMPVRMSMAVLNELEMGKEFNKRYSGKTEK